MAYVPPHMRQTSTSKDQTAQQKVDHDRFTIEEIQHHYWPNSQGEGEDRDAERLKHSTLNDSAGSPGLLSYLLLFHRANPRWRSDAVIYAKSNLDLLPQYREAKAQHASKRAQEGPTSNEQTASEPERLPDAAPAASGEVPTSTRQPVAGASPIDITPSNPRPIACFEQSARSMDAEGFVFSGYYTVSNIGLLAPHSPALARMLEQKWSVAGKQGSSATAKRRPEDWDRSLGYEWAVIRFARMDAGDAVPPPKIKKLPARERKPFVPRKSVNEMLAELRVGPDASAY